MAQPSYFFSFSTRFLLRPVLTSLKHLSGWENEKNQITNVYRIGSSAVSVIDGCFSVCYYSSNLHSFRIIKPITVCATAGTTFNGTISTTGDVRFWVSAPNYAEIVNLGIIDKTTTFSFVAQQNGTYTMNFENDMSNSIQVTFSYVTNPVIPGSNNSTGISQSYLLITVIIAVLGSFLIIFVLHRKSKTPPYCCS